MEGAAAQPGEPERLVSRAFAELLKRVGGHRARILDLGPAVGRNVAFLSRLRTKLYIADLHQTLAPEDGQAPRGVAFARQLERDLPDRAEGPFHAILAWDLLNYLARDEIATLGRALEPLSRRGTLLFALIWNRPELPGRPLTFEIEGRERLAYSVDPGLSRPAPRYKEADLQRGLPHFPVETTFLMRSGLQEYLLTHDGGGRTPAAR